MKPYKILGEIVLAIALIIVGYTLYKIGMNIRHDVPIIRGLVADDSVVGEGNMATTSECAMNNFDQRIYSVATYTETTSLLSAVITYPRCREDILAIIKDDYEKFKSENSEMIYASTSPNQNPVSYTVTYDELATTTYAGEYQGYKMAYYKYAGGAHGDPGMWSYNYMSGEKVNSIHDMYKIKSKEELYKLLHDEAKAQVTQSLKSALRSDGGTIDDETNIDMKWIEDGLSYSATNTINYDTWWMKGNDLYIYIAPYQVGPYSYGDREVIVPLAKLK